MSGDDVATVQQHYTPEQVSGGAKQPRARNDLHVALTENDGATASRLIETGDAILLNQQSRSGCTPLMLLAMGHCDESLLWRLLERRGDLGIALRSETRRTAADYASEPTSKRSSEVVEKLRALEAAEVQCTKAFRCCVCGDVVKRRPMLKYFWERADKGEEGNALLKRFFSNSCHKSLLKPQFHQINDTRQLRKELSESVSVLEALERAVPSFDGTWHVIDLCCGKSVTGALASMRYPGVVVSAVDKLEPRFLPHFDENDGERAQGSSVVTYMQIDVLSDGFVEELHQLAERVARPVALLGMHLCGQLSLRAIDGFAKLDAVRVVVLSPCCLPPKRDPASPQHLFISKDSTEQYRAWAAHLETRLRETASGADVTCQCIEDIISPKNIVICATKA